jgi:hypothetical protein
VCGGEGRRSEIRGFGLQPHIATQLDAMSLTAKSERIDRGDRPTDHLRARECAKHLLPLLPFLLLLLGHPQPRLFTLYFACHAMPADTVPSTVRLNFYTCCCCCCCCCGCFFSRSEFSRLGSFLNANILSLFVRSRARKSYVPSRFLKIVRLDDLVVMPIHSSPLPVLV